MKKLFLSITALAMTIFLSLGCVTKQVWTDKVKVEPYQERIISFYNNTKEEKIIFIGEKYHYIFDKGTKDFSKFLEARKRLNLKESSLNIHARTARTDREKIYTTISFQFNLSKLNQEQKNWIEKYSQQHINVPKLYQYRPQYTSVERDSYIVEYQLSGKRYQAKAEVNSQVAKLKKPLNIEVYEYKIVDKKSTLYKVAMTPLSVTADAGLIIIGAGAAIIYAPFGLSYWAYESITK